MTSYSSLDFALQDHHSFFVLATFAFPLSPPWRYCSGSLVFTLRTIFWKRNLLVSLSICYWFQLSLFYKDNLFFKNSFRRILVVGSVNVGFLIFSEDNECFLLPLKKDGNNVKLGLSIFFILHIQYTGPRACHWNVVLFLFVHNHVNLN